VRRRKKQTEDARQRQEQPGAKTARQLLLTSYPVRSVDGQVHGHQSCHPPTFAQLPLFDAAQ
jgi:hypothetical protein